MFFKIKIKGLFYMSNWVHTFYQFTDAPILSALNMASNDFYFWAYERWRVASLFSFTFGVICEMETHI